MGGGGESRLEAHKESSNCYLEQHDLQWLSLRRGGRLLAADVASHGAGRRTAEGLSREPVVVHWEHGEDRNRARKRSGASAAEDVDLRADSAAAQGKARRPPFASCCNCSSDSSLRATVGGWWLPHRRERRNHGQGNRVAARWANSGFPEIAAACFTGEDVEADGGGGNFRIAASGVRDITLRLEPEGRRRRGIWEAHHTGAARRGEASVPERCAPCPRFGAEARTSSLDVCNEQAAAGSLPARKADASGCSLPRGDMLDASVRLHAREARRDATAFAERHPEQQQYYTPPPPMAPPRPTPICPSQPYQGSSFPGFGVPALPSLPLGALAVGSEPGQPSSSSSIFSFGGQPPSTLNFSGGDWPDGIDIEAAQQQVPEIRWSRAHWNTQEHVIAERKRREKMQQQFVTLATIVPDLTKTDKISLLGSTIEYVKQLEEKVKTLEGQNARRTSEPIVFESKLSHIK
ncbi:transcription factor bHLH25-like [Panicum miliaceum]|uniref:Transcription factor bHLH25-like n=1 Tax=Panicum miliaceum TaxID=4540 RepID=A0A3L6TF84_PANMI|nr:transcription factor bHLH25-like [Panicum miliaceum]